MTAALTTALQEAGGIQAATSHTAHLKQLLIQALQEGAAELLKKRSGAAEPVAVGIASMFLDLDGATHPKPVLLAALPLDANLRADPALAGERGWLLAAATVGALVELADPAVPTTADDLGLLAGCFGPDFLLLGLPAVDFDVGDLDELGPMAFEENAGEIDRLRSAAHPLPASVLVDGVATLRAPIGANHPLLVAEAIARLGGHPADPRSVDAHEDAALALLQAGRNESFRPHEDPDPSRRIARRILQRLDGMGKWGGYHTEFAHLPRGFAGNERALAQEVGEALLGAGLLSEKPSVGQRHVFLNPRRAGDIRALIDEGTVPSSLRLP